MGRDSAVRCKIPDHRSDSMRAPDPSVTMKLIIYIFSALFVLISVGLFVNYYRAPRRGTLLLGLVYGNAAGLALVLMHWWPLVAGFVLAWVLRLLGFDPDIPRDPNS